MTAEDCLEAFSLEIDRVTAVNNCSAAPCACEAYKASPYSPGLVTDDEILHFLVPAPEARSENGCLLPPFASQLVDNGLSVLRGGASDDEFVRTIELLRVRWKEKKRWLEGVLTFSVMDVRYAGDERLCCVYDTAYEDRPHHADLMAPPATEGLSKTQRRKWEYQRIREIVLRIGSEFTTAADFRGGAFAGIAVPAE